MSKDLNVRWRGDVSDLQSKANTAVSSVASSGERIASVGRQGSQIFGQMSQSLATAGVGAGPLGSAITGVSGTLSQLGSRLDQTSDKFSATQKVGLGLGAIGAVVTGIGAAFTALAEPIEKADAQLKTAVTDAGGDLADYKDQFDAVEKQGEKFGQRMSSTASTLATLTTGLQDPGEAARDMGVAFDIAAKTGMDLNDVGSGMVKAFEGNGRMLKQFGITVPPVVDAEKEAKKASEDLATAQQKLAAANQNLADFEARTSAERSAAQEKYAAAVEQARTRVDDAQQSLKDTTERVNAAIADAVQRAADKVVAARQQQQAADESLADVEARLAAQSQDEQTRHAEAIRSAHDGLNKALESQRDLQQRLAVESATSASQQVSNAQERRHAEEAVAEARRKLTEAQSAPAESNEQQVSSAQELRHAQERAAQAASDTGKALADQADAATPTISQTQELAKANDAVAKAQGALTAEQAKGAIPAATLLAQQQEERRLRDAVAKATGDQTTAQKEQADAANAVREQMDRWHDILGQLEDRLGGQAAAQADTFGGRLRAMRAEAEDTVGVFGQKFGPAMMGIGPLMMIAAGAIELFAGGAAAALLPILGPVAIVVAAIAGIAAIGYLIVDNWHEIQQFLAGIWGDIEGFVKQWWPELLGVFTGGLATLVIEVYRHWGDIESFFASIPGRLLGFVDSAATWLVNTGINLMVGLWNGIAAGWKWFVGLVEDLFKRSFIGKVLNWLGVSSPSTVFAGIGANLMLGLQKGIVDNAGLPQAALAGVTNRLGRIPSGGLAPAAGSVAPAGPVEVHHYHESRITVELTNLAVVDQGELGRLTHDALLGLQQQQGTLGFN